MAEDDLVAVRTFLNHIEADLAKGALEAAAGSCGRPMSNVQWKFLLDRLQAHGAQRHRRQLNDRRDHGLRFLRPEN